MAVLAQEPFAAEYSTTTGDGAITLGGRIGNYKTLAEAGVADTNVVLAEIRLVSGGVTTEYEMAFYTYASSGPTLTIVGSPLRSSNSNNKVSWSAGTKQVVLSAPPFLYARDDRFRLVRAGDWAGRARFDLTALTAERTFTLPNADLNLAAGQGWVPVPTYAGGAASNVTVNSARYVRIGPAIHWNCDVSFRVGTGTGALTFAGLPVANMAAFAPATIAYLDRVDSIAGTEMFAGIAASASAVSFYSKVNDGTASVMASAGASDYFNGGVQDMRVVVGGTYFSA